MTRLGYVMAMAVSVAIASVADWVGMPAFTKVSLIVAVIFVVRYLAEASMRGGGGRSDE